MPQNIRLVLSGGGTGGHIIPNIALIQELKKLHKKASCCVELLYIGERGGMEEKMMGEQVVPFKGIWCGKLRRYFSWKNFLDFFKIPVGIIQAFFILKRFKPSVVFCKGGYVSFPVAVGAWMARIPVVLHESDVVPGLTIKLCARFARTIGVSFEESKRYFSARKKIVVTGNPVREEITKGSKEKALALTKFSANKPTILVMGGSQGATIVNTLVGDMLEKLLSHYQVIHICGKGKTLSLKELGKFVSSKNLFENYFSCEYANEALKDFYALANIVVSRAGAMSLAELDAIGKPTILIPLSKKASRGDQIVNAKIFAKTHICKVIEEESLSSSTLLKALEELLSEVHISSSQKNSSHNPTTTLIDLLLSYGNTVRS